MPTAAATAPEKKDKRPSTSHLKIVPETRELRDRVRAESARFVTSIDRSKTLTKSALQQYATSLLKEMELGERGDYFYVSSTKSYRSGLGRTSTGYVVEHIPAKVLDSYLELKEETRPRGRRGRGQAPE